MSQTATTSPLATTAVGSAPTPSSPTKATATTTAADAEADDPTAPPKAVLKTTPAALTADEKRQMRANKFADNRLSERAQRFGLTGADANSTVSSSVGPNAPVVDQKLKQRANRFGTVCDTLKKIEDTQRLDKRKERFAITSTTTASTAADSTSTADSLKRKGNFADKKQQRLARFGAAS